LNDQFRISLNPNLGFVFTTQGIDALSEEDKVAIFKLVQEFDDFTLDNEPYGEHDFGEIEYQQQSIFWKIDYYDQSMTKHSPDKSDPDVTVRVLTILLASEY